MNIPMEPRVGGAKVDRVGAVVEQVTYYLQGGHKALALLAIIRTIEPGEPPVGLILAKHELARLAS